MVYLNVLINISQSSNSILASSYFSVPVGVSTGLLDPLAFFGPPRDARSFRLLM